MLEVLDNLSPTAVMLVFLVFVAIPIFGAVYWISNYREIKPINKRIDAHGWTEDEEW